MPIHSWLQVLQRIEYSQAIMGFVFIKQTLVGFLIRYIDQKSGLIQLLRYPIGDRESQLLSAIDMTKRNPVLWSAKTQISGDLIHLLTDSTTNAIDSLKIFNNAIVAEQDSLNPFNLIK